MTYNSEHGQDRWLEENIFRGKRNGIFVELGALDGIYTSNTLFFERERDWSGILIEANPELFCQLLRSDRPRSRKLLAAVGSASCVSSFVIAKVPGWSGIPRKMDARHRQRINDTGRITAEFKVATLPLATILDQCLPLPIDYLSLDVEGAELAVLHGIDFNRCDIDVLDVENNYGEPAVEEFLRAFGYRKIHTIEINDIYRKD